MVSEKIKTHIKQDLRNQSPLTDFKNISGGCINACYSFLLNEKRYFLKINSEKTYPGMFEKEAKGLKLLSETKTLRIPEVISYGVTDNNESYILLEHIEKGRPSSDFWQNFGQQLAELHQNTHKYYGLDHNNYIGSLPQKNDFKSNWVDFFIECRLYPLSKQAYNQGLLNTEHLEAFIELYKELPAIMPEENPALLHGDLWSGNYMIDKEGNPVILDPAVYYGNRETELAFTQLFGGYDPEFYNAYQEAFPLQHGFKDRVDVYNLYPLLVHLILFGKSYLAQIESTLSRFD